MNQEVDINYIKRFSMCNCATVHFPDTYTAHAMTLDLFVSDLVFPGARLPNAHIDLWPNGYVRVYKIPKKIDTFLFSPFNEAYHPHYRLSDARRYSIGPHPDVTKIKELGEHIPRLTLEEFSDKLVAMERKVESLWGPVNKILVIYDNHNLDNATDKLRVMAYDAVTLYTLSWPIVLTSDPNQNKAVWCHYTDTALSSMLSSINKLEQDTIT